MKKAILNLVINEVRKNKAFRVILIKAIINYLNIQLPCLNILLEN